MFNADLALSVTMTAISTILLSIALPVNLLVHANFSYNADVIGDLDINAIHINSTCLPIKWGILRVFLLIVFSATVTNLGDADSRIWSLH